MAQWVDQARIEVRAGRGGDGASHFRREKYAPRGGPDGGDGGHGGDVVLVADPDLRTLVDFQFQRVYAADAGSPGEGNDRTGASGADVLVPVPPGTLVYDDDSGRLLADLATPGERFVAARGGVGGRGNATFKSAVRQAPTLRERGEPGQERNLRLELKLLADAALVGFPNAGKSTLISRLSSARPKIANYPFTTLTPNLGVVRLDDGASFVIADLPGLIEGAAEGKGLGHEFLRHLERARVIVHILDAAGFDRPDPVQDYEAIRAELEAYDPHLAQLPELVVANKIDLADARDLLDVIAEELAKRGVERLYPISAVTGEGLDELRDDLARIVMSTEAESVVEARAVAELDIAEEAPDDGFSIEQDEEDIFVVEGRQVERAVAMTDLDNEEGVMHLHRQLVEMGVIQALRDAGCGEGDAVRIGDVILDFEE